MPVDRLVDGMTDFGHQQLIFDTVASGRGVVVGLPHMGNWDQAGAWIIAKGAGSFTTVMERLKPETVYERFVSFREGLGMEVLPASGGAAHSAYWLNDCGPEKSLSCPATGMSPAAVSRWSSLARRPR